MSSCNYNPMPARVWSRVQNPCTFITPGLPEQYTRYIPLTNKTVSQAQADYENKQIYKGNILQYKGNSARLTKTQRYSQLARCSGPNRTKVYATQSQTYTNPNTTGLLRSGFQTYNYPNEIVGAPNNISGPFQYNVSNPNDCSSNAIQDGGILVCGTYANPCSGEIYIKSSTNTVICNSTSASNVPGSGVLCWNKKVQTWFPRQKYTMNNSTNKWPINYKGLVSALSLNNPPPPTIYFLQIKNGTIFLKWKYIHIFNVDSFNIYINNIFIETIPFNNSFLYSINIEDLELKLNSHKENVTTKSFNRIINYKINFTSVNSQYESMFSNTLFINNPPNINNEDDDSTDVDTCDHINDCCDDLKTDLNSINDNLLSYKNEIISTIINEINIKMIPINDSLISINSILENVINKSNNILDKITQLKSCCCDSSCNCDFYNSLFTSESISQINHHVTTYISTAYEPTDTYITIDEFNELNIGLENLRLLFETSNEDDVECCFSNIIDVYKNMLKIVKYAYDEKNLKQSTLVNSEQWKQDSIILNDRDKLKEFLESLQKSFSIIDLAVTAKKVTIKIQYQTYHDRYGIPNNLEYDPILLQNIMTELGLM